MIKLTDSFVGWLDTLSLGDQGTVIGYIEAFDRLRQDIIEPYGAVVKESRHWPNVYLIYPKTDDTTYVVYCVLADDGVHVIHGRDANAAMDLASEQQRVDQMIDNEDIF